MSLQTLANPIEAQIATELVEHIIGQGYCISVHDGEEYVVKKSGNVPEVLNAMASADEDTLRVRTPEGQHVGAIFLVYGNGKEIVADMSDNEATTGLVEAITKKYED